MSHQKLEVYDQLGRLKSTATGGDGGTGTFRELQEDDITVLRDGQYINFEDDDTYIRLDVIDEGGGKGTISGSFNEEPLDNRYFRENEFLDESAGASDSGLPVILDETGKLDDSFFPAAQLDTTVYSFPVPMDIFLDRNQKLLDENVHGALLALATGDTLGVGDDIVVSKGTGKVVFVVNAGADVNGTLTITGTSVNRNTGAETALDTDDITIAGTSTDNSDTDAEGNARYAFQDAYISSKWFIGSITISTADLDISDIDVYHISFEQVNDEPDIILTTFDVNVLVTNANAWLYSYMYAVDVTGSNVDITREASLSIPDGTAIANQYYRLRRGQLGVALNGSTDGFFVDTFFGPPAQTYIEDYTMKVWAAVRQEIGVGSGTFRELQEDDVEVLRDGEIINFEDDDSFIRLDVIDEGGGKGTVSGTFNESYLERGWVPRDDFLDVSAGAADVGKAIKLNTEGLLPDSMINLNVKEQDGAPSVDNVKEIRVTNTTLTDEGGGVVSIDTGGGAGGGTGTFRELQEDDATVLRDGQYINFEDDDSFIRLDVIDEGGGKGTISGTFHESYLERGWVPRSDFLDVSAGAADVGKAVKLDATGKIDASMLNGGGGLFSALAIVQHQETSGTNGGTATQGSWLTRPLNTEVVDTGGDVAVASNQITLEAGTYFCTAFSTFCLVNTAGIRLYNISDSSIIAVGMFGGADSGDFHSQATLQTYFTIAAQKVIEVQYQVTATRADYGLGRAKAWGTEVYASIALLKLT